MFILLQEEQQYFSKLLGINVYSREFTVPVPKPKHGVETLRPCGECCSPDVFGRVVEGYPTHSLLLLSAGLDLDNT